MTPYYADDLVTLYHGDCREVLPALNVTADCVVADPPYGETSLPWDRWPAGWLEAAALVTRSLWCFGSLRMFLDRRDEFAGWRLSQDVVWVKPTQSGCATDRFSRSHETVTHWYQGQWREIYREPPKIQVGRRHNRVVRRPASEPQWMGERGASAWSDDGSRFMRSVLEVATMYRRGVHPTEKPLGIIDPLITYACPPGGLVVDPFAGSGSTLDAARCTGRRAIGVEADEKYIEQAARRLSQQAMVTA